MRIALFGGSFDPPHRGHLALATAAADAFRLDRVLFAPAGRQPLKAETASASFTDRLAMVTLVCAQDAAGRLQASDLDRPHADNRPNYTVDTLASLAILYPDAELFAIAGVDSFRSLGHWRSPHRLLAQAEWIVVSRPGVPSGTGVVPDNILLTPAEHARIHLLDTVHEDVSATMLRQKLEAGEDCGRLLPPGVAAYIADHRLYLRRT